MVNEAKSSVYCPVDGFGNIVSEEKCKDCMHDCDGFDERMQKFIMRAINKKYSKYIKFDLHNYLNAYYEKRARLKNVTLSSASHNSNNGLIYIVPISFGMTTRSFSYLYLSMNYCLMQLMDNNEIITIDYINDINHIIDTLLYMLKSGYAIEIDPLWINPDLRISR